LPSNGSIHHNMNRQQSEMHIYGIHVGILYLKNVSNNSLYTKIRTLKICFIINYKLKILPETVFSLVNV
jgi:hypothetical protein